MKYVIILLLSTTGLEEIKIKTNGLNCGEIAESWREVNTVYYPAIEGDAKRQGNYTKEGKLLVGHICE
tara:strand:- start:373 stop:576 length:204 start_codon:yes stop_codon:yes gene_type:complete